MAEVHKLNDSRSMKVPEFLREPLEAAQVRIGQIEEDAKKLLEDLMDKGRASRKDFEQIVHRLTLQDLSSSLPELKQRIEKLRDQGAERAAELRDRAETLRSEALERMSDLQSRAVAFLGVATREQVEELSKELERLSRRLEKSEKGLKKAKKSQRPSAEV